MAMESIEMISASSRSASSTAVPVLPEPVGPVRIRALRKDSVSMGPQEMQLPLPAPVILAQDTSKPCVQNANHGMVQMRVTPGPKNQAQRTQSVSPIGLVVNGLHCAASHTHTTSLRCHLTCQLLNHA